MQFLKNDLSKHWFDKSVVNRILETDLELLLNFKKPERGGRVAAITYNHEEKKIEITIFFLNWIDLQILKNAIKHELRHLTQITNSICINYHNQLKGEKIFHSISLINFSYNQKYSSLQN